jgi:hypothetical protein
MILIGLSLFCFVVFILSAFYLYFNRLILTGRNVFPNKMVYFGISTICLLSLVFMVVFITASFRGYALFSRTRTTKVLFSDEGLHCKGDPEYIVRYHSCSSSPVAVTVH